MFGQSEQQKKYEQAILQTQMAGVVALVNVESCCRSCASYEMAQQGVKEDTKLVWTFAGQDSRVEWQDGRPMRMVEHELEGDVYYEEEEDDEGNVTEVECYGDPDIEYRPEPAEDVYWYHSAGGAAVLVEKMKAAGFEVEWDGTETDAVLVKFSK
jgi:hypothetical protein